MHSAPSSSDARARASYRPDIDGLRAIAVLAVLAFHVHPASLRGGFVGVDIFFVLSGYLISGILFRGLRDGTLDLRDFYVHRVKRIFPALIAVLLACLVAGWWLLLPAEFAQLGKHVAAGGAFVQNIVLQQEAGYFDTAAELKPLLHLWSLAIEEQFYLIYPLLLLLAWRRRWPLLGLVLALTLASFGWNLLATRQDLVAAYFLPQTRFWELLAGALLAHRQTFRAPQPSPERSRWADGLSVAGLLLLALSLTLVHKDKAFPGWWALLPVLGTLSLVAAGPQACVNRALLSSRPLVLVGLISYPLYLWHWPLLSFARILSQEPLSLTWLSACVALSFALAWLTYRFLERPIRYGPPRRATTAALSSAMVALAGLGLATLLAGGVAQRLPDEVREIADFRYDAGVGARVEACWLTKDQPPDGFAPECTAPDPGGPASLVIWGDSHAGRLYPGLLAVLGEHAAVSQFNRNGCPPVLGMGYEVCQRSNQHVIERIGAMRPQTVLLFANWGGHATDWAPDSEPARRLLATTEQLHRLGVRRVVVLGPAPYWKEALPKLMYQAWRSAWPRHVPERLATGLRPDAAGIDRHLAALFDGSEVVYGSVWKALCNGEGCLTHMPGEPTQLFSWDYGHLTIEGATYLMRALRADDASPLR